MGSDPFMEAMRETQERLGTQAPFQAPFQVVDTRPPIVVEHERKRALRYNEGKPELHYLLFFSKAIEAVAAVCTYGARKYDAWNFARGGKPSSEYLASCLRHLTKWQGGEDVDPESGCHHLGHALWNLLALAHFTMTGNAIDDRPSKVLAANAD